MFEFAISAISLGLAFASVRTIPWGWALVTLAAGLVAGYFAIPPLPGGLTLASAFIATGALLICSSPWVSKLIVPVMLAIGALLGHVARDPAGIGAQGGLIQLSLAAFIAAAAFLARRHFRDWYSIPRRIGGSWLLAAGCMLLALFLRSPDKPLIASSEMQPPIHDPNQPHIHGPNGEIIYLSTGRKEPAAAPSKKPGILPGLSGNQTIP